MEKILISFCCALLAMTGCKNTKNIHEAGGKIDVTISSEMHVRFHLQNEEKEQWLTTPFTFSVSESVNSATYRFISVNPKQKLTMQVLEGGRKTIEVNASMITLNKFKGGLRGSGSGSN